MSQAKLALLPMRQLAVAIACGLFSVAQADEGDQTLGVQSSVSLPVQAKGNPPSWAGKAFRQGVVTAGNPYGAEAGAQILEQGGNAIDAAVAIAYALNVVEPQSAGIGGGGFMMIHIAKTGQTVRDRFAREGAGGCHAHHVRRRAEPKPAGCGRRRSGNGARHGQGARGVRQSLARAGAAARDQAGRRGLRRDATLYGGELQQRWPIHQLA